MGVARWDGQACEKAGNCGVFYLTLCMFVCLSYSYPIHFHLNTFLFCHIWIHSLETIGAPEQIRFQIA